MATMRPLFRRVELSWIGLLLVGALCGALVMFGVDALRQSDHHANAPIVVAPVANRVPIGGRLGGIVSADTANGWYLLHEYNPPALPSTANANREDVQGQRDISAPTAVPQRVVGPGEGLNTVAPDGPVSVGIPPIIDTTEGLHSKR
jgi:hypothetical protein